MGAVIVTRSSRYMRQRRLLPPPEKPVSGLTFLSIVGSQLVGLFKGSTSLGKVGALLHEYLLQEGERPSFISFTLSMLLVRSTVYKRPRGNGIDGNRMIHFVVDILGSGGCASLRVRCLHYSIYGEAFIFPLFVI